MTASVNDLERGLSYRLGGGLRTILNDLVRVCRHLIVEVHADFAEDLVVDFVGLQVGVGISNHLELILHHFLIHSHFLSFHSELLHDLIHLLRIH